MFSEGNIKNAESRDWSVLNNMVQWIFTRGQVRQVNARFMCERQIVVKERGCEVEEMIVNW